ncbi:MAG TPA: L-threonine 3-dehydrogenase [Alphaproteobacteria bacterium]|nr:L-threonine 3-dehydrogenase [Alphaproteobacteria bacterium]
MKALIKNKNGFAVDTTKNPKINSATDVIIKVAMAGLCRTDVFVAEGAIKSKDELVLGHEFSGTVSEVGRAVTKFKAGDRVTVMPVIACGKCEQCKTDSSLCQNVTMLGVNHDGCFAEYISVPENVVYHLPDNLPFKAGAYTEPLAASLAVIKVNLPKNGKGLIYGKNRIAELTRRVMLAHGYTDVLVYDEREGAPLHQNSYDFIIETIADTKSIEKIIDAVRPQGKIIIKSRKYELVGINFAKIVRKEITFQAVNYGNFDETITLMASGKLDYEDLLGNVYNFEEFKDMFKNARKSEEKKIFLSPEKL